MLDVLLDALRSAVLITGLVVVMMMLIESFNVESRGRIFKGLRKSGLAQVTVSALLGSIPGCVGGFAAVSLYTHRMISFGALLAMMIATAGDESFMMLALFPGKALWIFLILLVLAILTGVAVDRIWKDARPIPTRLEDTFELHDHEGGHEGDENSAHNVLWKRVVMFIGVLVFIAALVSGFLEEEEPTPDGLNLLSEQWMYLVFGVLSLVVLGALLFASDHFVGEHLWEHIVCKHLPSLFTWTFLVLLVIGTLFHYVDIETWVKGNTAIMILIAIAVGLIPESGPHLVFVTLFASGVIPFPVLLANSIVQDGHASLPLLADSKRAFVKAKAIKVGIALVVFVVWGLLL